MKQISLALSFFILFFTSGCIESKQLNEAKIIDQQINLVSQHIQKISQESGSYRNDEIDFSLLKKVKQETISQVESLINCYQSNQCSEQDLNSNLKKANSLLYFIWMEELDNVISINLKTELINLSQEHENYIKDPEIEKWLKNNQLLDKSNNISTVFNDVINLLANFEKIKNNYEQLKNLQTDLDQLKQSSEVEQYNKKADEYNNLLDETNKISDDYNAQIKKYTPEYIDQSFIALIDISQIFPGQNDLPLKND